MRVLVTRSMTPEGRRPASRGVGVRLVAAVRPDREVLALGDVLPKGVDAGRYDRSQPEIFREGQLLAAVAAARSSACPSA